MYLNSIGMMNNAAFSTMQNCNALMNLTSAAGNGSFQGLGAMNQAEKRLLMENQQNGLTYKAYDLMEKSQKEQKKAILMLKNSLFKQI